MDDLPTFSRLFLLWAPLAATLIASRWFGWIGLGIAMALTLSLFVFVASLFGESWGADSASLAVRTAYIGAFWGWVVGFGCAVALFVGWCRRNLKAGNQ